MGKKEGWKIFRKLVKAFKELGKELGMEITTLKEEEIDEIVRRCKEYKNQVNRKDEINSELLKQIGYLLGKSRVRLPGDIYKMLLEEGYKAIKEGIVYEDEKYILSYVPGWLAGREFRVGERIRYEHRKNVAILDTSGTYDKLTIIPNGIDLKPFLTEAEEKYGAHNIYPNSITFSKEYTNEILELVKKFIGSL